MTLLEAIDLRVSVRHFANARMDAKKSHYLSALVYDYNKASGLSMVFLDDVSKAFKHYSHGGNGFKGVRSAILLKGSERDPLLHEKLGYYGEKLVLEATRLDIGSCWVTDTYDVSTLDFPMEEDDLIVGIIPIGHMEDRRTLTGKLIRPEGHKSKPAKDFFVGEKGAPVWVFKGIEAIQRAPSYKNRQPVTIHHIEGMVAISVPGKASTDLIDLGIAKLHFEIAAEGKFEYYNGAMFIKERVPDYHTLSSS